MWQPIAFFAGAMLFVAGPLVVWKVLSHGELTESWRAWARARELEFVEATGPWLRRTGMHVRGQRGAVRFDLHLCIEKGRRNGAVFTRLVANGPEIAGVALELRRRWWLELLNRRLMDGWIEIDDAHLAERWLVRAKRTGPAAGDDAERCAAATLIAGDFRKRLIEFQHVEFVGVAGGELDLRMRGEIGDERVLDDAVELACAAWSSVRAPLRKAS